MFTAFLIFFSSAVIACDLMPETQYPVVPALGGYIYFAEMPIDEKASHDEVGLNIYYKNCSNGKVIAVGELPYLAATGKVYAAFFKEPITHDDNQLVVIHGVGIRSDTGVAYSSDYYSVHVYDVKYGSYALNERVFKYFGYGGDVVNLNNDAVIYRYPYKTEKEVRTELNSDYFKIWMRGDTITCRVERRAFLYSSPVVVDLTGEYVSSGDVLKQIDSQAGWTHLIGQAVNGKNVNGWVKRDEYGGNCGL